jgi:hypothetical protein
MGFGVGLNLLFGHHVTCGHGTQHHPEEGEGDPL